MWCKSGKGCRMWSCAFVIVAVILALLACLMPADQVGRLLGVAKFFDVMLPILGAGALIKYLFSHHACCGSKDNGECGKGACETK